MLNDRAGKAAPPAGDDLADADADADADAGPDSGSAHSEVGPIDLDLDLELDSDVGSKRSDAARVGPPRSKTITWQDPHALAAAGRTLTGLEFIRKIAARELHAPPIAELIGMTIDSVEVGDVVFRCAPDESSYNPLGVIHGGLACVLLDTVTGCAVHTTLDAGVGYTSLEIKVNYLRPIHGGTTLIAHGWVTKPGKRAAFAEGDLRDESGRVLATASSTCLVMGQR